MTSVQIFALCVLCFLLGIGFMVGIIKLSGCEHEYEMTQRDMRHLFSDGTTHYTELIIIQRCKKCGKIKVKQITPKGM